MARVAFRVHQQYPSREAGMRGSGTCVVAVVGASAGAPPPGLEQPPGGCDLRFIPDRESLAREAADADVAFVWQPRLDWLATEWGWSERLRWVAAATVGVDSLLFPALVDSDIVVTNCAGVFDEAMAEYALTLVSAICADLHTTMRLQYERRWLHRETARLAGREVLIAGAGGIGRAIARTLARAGAHVRSVGRDGRMDAELGWVAPVSELGSLLSTADYLILALPLTNDTHLLVGSGELAQMRHDAWLINLGRGTLVDEPALTTALLSGTIGGAALDVFTDEPLSPASPLWMLPNVIVSPHMSGDFHGWEEALVGLFLRQLQLYRSGKPLANVVDKRLGFIPGTRPC
jgi:phosphoglycerate dehydrogenase-like enzyme